MAPEPRQQMILSPILIFPRIPRDMKADWEKSDENWDAKQMASNPKWSICIASECLGFVIVVDDSIFHKIYGFNQSSLIVH